MRNLEKLAEEVKAAAHAAWEELAQAWRRCLVRK